MSTQSETLPVNDLDDENDSNSIALQPLPSRGKIDAKTFENEPLNLGNTDIDEEEESNMEEGALLGGNRPGYELDHANSRPTRRHPLVRATIIIVIILLVLAVCVVPLVMFFPLIASLYNNLTSTAECSLTNAPEQTWHGWSEIRYIGDSYSDTRYKVSGEHPDERNPLGNPAYPGDTLSGGPNWVGYLATENNQSAIRVYNYAIRGNVVQGVESQVNKLFLPYAAGKPDWANWTAQNSIFFTWIGINDILNEEPRNHLERQHEVFRRVHESLYEAGARNFVFLNVPPFERAPCCSNWNVYRAGVRKWNTLLEDFAFTFRQQHNASVAIYDTQGVFNALIDDPATYGFKDTSTHCLEKECMWFDTLHPSWSVHKILAADLGKGLSRAANLTNILNSGGV